MLFLFRRRWLSYPRSSQLVHDFDNHEDGESDDKEVDDVVQERAPLHGTPGKGAEIRLGEDVGDRAQDDVFDQGIDDGIESETDDYADGQIDGIAFDDKSLEFLYEALHVRLMIIDYNG